jgi:hypothetical protein
MPNIELKNASIITHGGHGDGPNNSFNPTAGVGLVTNQTTWAGGGLIQVLGAMGKSGNPAPKPAIAPHHGTENDGAEHFASYREHANILRTWLVAYGVGGPVLILSQDKIWGKLSTSGSLRLIAVLFLTGVSLQVASAAINKSVMWACYYGETEPMYKATVRYKIANWLSGQYLIDFTCDTAAMATFAAATYFSFSSLVS